ncbi:glycosyltransferase [Gulosibacter sp. 10]|uniref:glycosyltransferase n=1 Tax=Gulosibacter sp. 10 TaxID=1255570 RepID=UPI0015956939|nr:glycosyltransferase [Gulosibacter sp. 10]
MGFFLLAAVIASVAAFWLDDTILIVSLFWLLALSVFIMIMFIRRLNAAIARVRRDPGSLLKKKNVEPRSRLESSKDIETLRKELRSGKRPAVVFPLAKKILQQAGGIREAGQVLGHLKSDLPLATSEREFIERVRSLNRYLDAEYELPQQHHTYNYVPAKDKVLYAVGISPISVSNGYTSRTQGVATGMASRGLDVVVAPMPGKPWDKGPQPGYRVPGEHRRFTRAINGVTYAHNPGGKAWEGDIDVFFQISADAYVREALIDKPEFILAASNYLSALPALIAARRLGIPFVYEMRGFWEVTAASVNPAWADTDQYALDRKFELFVAQNADKIVVITDEMKQDLIERGVDGAKISVAPNCVDPEKFAPLGKDLNLCKRIGFERPELPVIGFAGSVTDYEGLDLVVQALADLKEAGKEFNFLLIGGGKHLPVLQKEIGRLRLDAETRQISGIPNEQMPVYLSSIDIFPLARQSLPVTELVSPLKPLEAMATGGAVLLSDVSPHGVFYGENQDRALKFDKGDASSLRSQLERLLDDAELRRRLGWNAREWILENRQWSHSGAVFETVFRGLRAEWKRASSADAEAPLKSYTVAFIGDVFTTDTFVPELTAVRVTPDDWREQYKAQKIDALFIESAWRGNDGAWTGTVGYYDDETHAPIVELIEYSRENGIPVMFWNKEDPVHFNRFKRTAALCDYVFTTDARTIPAYKSLEANRIKVVASAPFAAQPLLHNPLPTTREKEDTIAYGGTYYGDKYATRKQGLDFLFYESAPYGLAIYERIHNDPNSPYKLPERFKRYARESLSYPEMCQAYKAHPIHLNGNSVVDSPSMFSRRVVEITASGASVLSSPGQGVDETLAGTVPTVSTAEEAFGALRRWKESEQVRHRDLWRSLRHVYEAHTCAHRLVYMLRVAGLSVQSPRLERFAVECSVEDVLVFEQQSVRPDLYLLDSEPTQELAGLPVRHVLAERRGSELRERGIDHVIRAQRPVGKLGNHDVEDLVSALRFGQWKAVGKRAVRWDKGDPYVPIATLNADINQRIVLYGLEAYESITAGTEPVLDDGEVFAWQVVTEASEPKSDSIIEQAGKPTVLIAGHDFKFFPQISAAIQEAGHKVLVDRWQGHAIHDEEYSRKLLAEADVIFCEWALGNVRWYSQNKLPGQKLITRLHAQELRTRHLADANIDNIDTFVFVSPVGMRRAQVLFGIPSSKCVVIGNTFDFDRFDSYRPDINAKNLGFVGSVPQSKRFDIALDIVEQLAAEDPEVKLLVKGKEYTEYEWLLKRPAEKAFFEEQYRRIGQSSALQEAVVFGGHSSDIAAWYNSEPGFVLSTSDHEGTHQAIAEGGAAGCVPIILPWAGAELVYGRRWLVRDAEEAVARIRELVADPEKFKTESNAVREYMYEHFRPERIGREIVNLL